MAERVNEVRDLQVQAHTALMNNDVACAVARSGKPPTATRWRPSLPASPAAAREALAVRAPARRTCTFSPSTASSFDSATASRSGRLGRTTVPFAAASAVRFFAASRSFSSAGDCPETMTSYRSAPLERTVVALATVATRAPRTHSSTVYLSSRSLAATFFAAAASLKAPTCTNHCLPETRRAAGVVALAVIVAGGFWDGGTTAAKAMRRATAPPAASSSSWRRAVIVPERGPGAVRMSSCKLGRGLSPSTSR